jgi:hypothetical protein
MERTLRQSCIEPRPYRYRLEHHCDAAAPRILRRLQTVTAASAALTREERRLAVNGTDGWVVLIDQGVVPEKEVSRCRVSKVVNR